MNENVNKNIESLVNDCSINLLVSSPAGSGKTMKLTERYVAILCKQFEELQTIEPQRIVAITFTEKAAAEMKGRIISILKKYEDMYPIFLSKLSKVRISTMHSFFFSLYRRFALDAGENPNVEVMDENQQTEIIDNLFRQLIFGKINFPNQLIEPLTFLLSVFGWNKVKDLIQKMFSIRTKLYRVLENDKDVTNLHLNNAEKEHKRNRIFNYGQFLQDYIKELKEKPLEASRKIKKIYSSEINNFGIEIFQILCDMYEKIKKDIGKIDYDDMELSLLRLIKDDLINYNLLYDFDLQFDYLLIDEFQDTNYIQWEIIGKLIEEWFAGRGAKEESGKLSSVFLVGDSKQSIYFFRGANVEVMNIVSRIFEQRKQIPEYSHRYELVTEKRNFRSRYNIVEFVNKAFTKIMKSDKNDDLWRTKYEYFECNRDRDKLGEVAFIIYKTGGSIRASESANAEANLVAKKILELHYQGSSFSDIAILLRARTYLNQYENVLLNNNIPYRVYRGQGFFKEKEIQLMLSLLKFLYDPYDDISLFSILRSPFYNFTDDDLINLANVNIGDEHNSSMFQRLQKYNLKIYEQLLGFVNDYKTLHSYIVLNRFLINKKGYYYLSEKQRYANIIKLLNLLEEMEYNSEDKLEINKKLKYMEERGDLEKATILDEGYNAVTIMTVHSAKGLEYSCVFVVGISHGERSKYSPIISLEKTSLNGPIKVKTNFSIFPEPNEDELVKEHKARNMEEYKRLFYVACTRARERLFLTGVVGKRIASESWLGMLEKNGLIKISDNKILLGDEISNCASVESYAEIPLLEKYRPEKLMLKRYYDFAAKSKLNISIMVPSMPIDDKLNEFSAESHLRDVGEIIHIIMDKYTKRMIALTEFEAEAIKLLKYYDYDEGKKLNLLNCIDKIKESKIIKVASPMENTYSEFSFIYREESKFWKGRVDLIRLLENKLIIYDYKISNLESEQLIRIFLFQIKLYSKALSKIWRGREVEEVIIRISPIFGVDFISINKS